MNEDFIEKKLIDLGESMVAVESKLDHIGGKLEEGSEIFKKHDEAIYGNGRRGILSRLSRAEMIVVFLILAVIISIGGPEGVRYLIGFLK